MPRRLLRPAFLFLASLTASCGSGDTQPSPETTSFAVESYALTRTSFQGEGQPPSNSYGTPAGYIFLKSVGLAPTTPVFARVNDTGQVFGNWTVEVRDTVSETITARHAPNLPVGTHTGTLTLQLCKSVACEAVYPITGGTLTYAVIIRPQLAIDIYVSGELVESLPAWIGYTKYLYHTGGKRIEIRANLPIDVRYANEPGRYELIKDESGSTETRWIGTLNATPGQLGSVYVEIRPSASTGSPQAPYVVDFGFD